MSTTQRQEIFFPPELRSMNNWFLWRIEEQNGRKTKVPYSANYDGHASSTNPETWSSFDRAWNKLQSQSDKYGGVGIAISDGLIFIDIDHCIDEAGHINEVASEIIALFPDQFIEISQSGSGIHIITKGTITRNFKNTKTDVEMYASKRFVSMTGHALQKGSVSNTQSSVDKVFEKYKTPERVKASVRSEISSLQKDDRWIIEHASDNGKFRDLYMGNWKFLGFESQSEADLSLCVKLAFWTNRDPDQIDRIFRSSGLYRSKWERSDYRETTVGTACDLCQTTLDDYITEKRLSEVKELEKKYSEEWDFC